MLFNEFDILDFENEIFLSKIESKSNFRKNYYDCRKLDISLNFSIFSNDNFFYSKILKIKDQTLNNEHSDFKISIINNKNMITKLHNFVDITKNLEFEYET